MKFVKNLKGINKKDVSTAGGKGANLGELMTIKIPVPAGFVILASAFEEFLKETGVNTEIETMWDRINTEDMESIEEQSEIIRDIILKKEFPEKLKEEILKTFDDLKMKYVAVRSSATAEDSRIDAWAGQLETYLYSTREKLLNNIQKCWASLYSPRALFYRVERKLDRKQVSVAVVIQEMIDSELSGVCFTVHPITENKNQMIIEACWGLGEALVSGIITPDSYVVEKNTFDLISINVQKQKKQVVKSEKGTLVISVPVNIQERQKLSEKRIKELAEICAGIERHYDSPQDIEWVLEKNKFYIVQSRPITTL